MKRNAFVEPGTLLDGSRVFRMNCETCKRHGVWLKDLNAVENTVTIHERSEHQRAVA